jgi:hypothetical protein
MKRAILALAAVVLLVSCGASPTEPGARSGAALPGRTPAPTPTPTPYVSQFTICPCGLTYYVPTHTCIKGLVCPCGWIFDAFAGCIAPMAPTPTPPPGGYPTPTPTPDVTP